MSEPLAPQYNPQAIESELYRFWKERGLFSPDSKSRRAEERKRAAPQLLGPSALPYVVMMPPPNVTAVLHMGHGLNNTIQDVLVRFERMRGRAALWLPGTDHAGIATQNAVERLLAKEGQTRFDLGREPFIDRVWGYVRETGAVILRQLEALGCSADWSRTYFTFNDDLSGAVREAFVRLYEKGLIYRGHYIINWCPRCLTALSNEEAEKEEEAGRIWRLRYPLADGSGHVTVATTRPETMLGDTGVAVHPGDERYGALVGRQIRLPLTDRLIPILADDAVDPAFGTGAVKITPAHDPLDFEIGRRHGLASIDVMTPEARMSLAAPERYQGLDRYEARRRVVEELEALGLLEGVEQHRHAVGRCYRCETAIEPRLSEQWFVKMAPLARPALQAYRDGRLRFVPERRGADYARWMENIRDWCISRQLWWGHRIPVWYCQVERCGKMVASRVDIERCPDCGGPVRQDDDVLDTWFSSQLVPFSSLGWPDPSADLARFYPGQTLVTAPEILFFWVARMVMAGLEFMGEIPFSTVYLHGTVRDTQHRKMSKSLGNGIDPLDVVALYGADALRYTLVAGSAVGTDVILDPNDIESSFAPGRNFANKLWNAGRFILAHLQGPVRPLAGRHRDAVRREELSLADRWIIVRCDATVGEVTDALERFRLNDAAAAAYRFVWSDLADWYIEQIKPRLAGDRPGGDVARAVAAQTFDVALRLLHPVVPFITEALWQRLPGRTEDMSISVAAWPRPDERAADPAAVERFGAVQELVSAVRALRGEYGVLPGQWVPIGVTGWGPGDVFADEKEMIRHLARISELDHSPTEHHLGAHAVLRDGTGVFMPAEGVFDIGRESERLEKEGERLTRAIESQQKKLANEQFTSRAPVEVVQREREKLADWSEQLRELTRKRKGLELV
ncbi:MAG: valine--tRNA ligase [Gemmatimonadales bacterium]